MTNKRLINTFSKLVAIDSVSKNEAKVHEYLINEIKKLGLEIIEDDSQKKTGLGGNNIIAKYSGTKKVHSLFFSSHTDTVSPGIGIEVIEKDGVLHSKGDTILAADDKAGIAIMIEAIKRIQEQKIEVGSLEFVLSPGEEIGLIGSSALDMNLIEAKNGYVLDSGGPVGRVTIASPTLYMYDVTISGQAAHAGLEPEKGISTVSILSDALSKIKIGRLNDTTTANIGVIQGGEATNVIMDKMLVKGEVRSVDVELADKLIREMSTAFEEAAVKYGGSVVVDYKKMATGFNISDDELIMKLLSKAAENLKYEVIREVSGGGSDANVFNEKGKNVVNLSIGYEKIHTTDEYIPIKEMENAVNLVIELAKLSPPTKE